MTLAANSVLNANVDANAAIARTKLAQDALKTFPIDLDRLFVWDAPATRLPGTSASDDLGFYAATYGTSVPLVRTYDVKNAGAVTLRARILVALPLEYDPGESIQFRFKAGMVTTIASASASIDVEAFKSDKGGAVSGVDLVSTAAQSINSLVFANKDFDVTATGLVPGDVLDVRITIAVSDTATATAVIAAFGSAELLLDIRG